MGKKNRHVARLFHETRTADPVVLGGKGRGLAEMVALGLPVPAGFVITTSVSRAMMVHEGRFPKRLEWHLQRCMRQLEQQTGKRFGDPANPLLVSVRSGAPVSMPGMMDTILNLGMTEQIRETLARQHGERFAKSCLRRFSEAYFGSSDTTAYVSLPSPWDQLRDAIKDVISSWNSLRAIMYRKVNGISDALGTAVTVQEMVFGNKDHKSCSGVVFSCNTTTGESGMYGEFLVKAQGEDVVSGTHTGWSIRDMRTWNSTLYSELEAWVMKLERHFGHAVDVEFTVESGTLYLLQVRQAKLAPLASAIALVHDVWEKRITKERAVANVTPEQLVALRSTGFSEKSVADHCEHLVARGLPVAAGAVVGYAALSCAEAIRMANEGKRVVLFRPDTTPNDLEGMLAAKAIVTAHGGVTCHAAVTARGMGITAVVGCASLRITGIEVSSEKFVLRSGDLVSVDGSRGLVFRGAINSVMGTQVKEVHLLEKWVRAHRPELFRVVPRVNWDAMDKMYNVNTICNDFYLADAMASAAAASPLAAEAATLRQQIHQEAAEMFACYLIVAVSGELQYLYDGTSPGCAQLCDELRNRFDLPRMERGAGYHQGAYNLVQRSFPHLPLSEVVKFLDIAVVAFTKYVGNGAVAGSRWAAIAQAARDFLKGEFAHSVFVDHVFDLKHNGGVLFDKHPMVRDRREDILQLQLNAKKSTVKLEDLRAQLLNLHIAQSPEVSGLWERGVQLKLWGTALKEERRP